MVHLQRVVYLGEGGNNAAETRALLMANNVDHGDFPAQVMHELAPLLPAAIGSGNSASR